MAGKVIVGSEFVKQPKAVDGLASAEIPTTVSYFARILPPGTPMNIDVAIVRAAGEILPDVDLKAQNRFGLGISYRF